eukprot:3771489-Prymnesium_polylepis.1
MDRASPAIPNAQLGEQMMKASKGMQRSAGHGDDAEFDSCVDHEDASDGQGQEAHKHKEFSRPFTRKVSHLCVDVRAGRSSGRSGCSI